MKHKTILMIGLSGLVFLVIGTIIGIVIWKQNLKTIPSIKEISIFCYDGLNSPTRNLSINPAAYFCVCMRQDYRDLGQVKLCNREDAWNYFCKFSSYFPENNKYINCTNGSVVY